MPPCGASASRSAIGHPNGSRACYVRGDECYRAHSERAHEEGVAAKATTPPLACGLDGIAVQVDLTGAHERQRQVVVIEH
jgi:hypothetical protein